MNYDALPRDDKGKIISREIEFPVRFDLLAPIPDGETEIDMVEMREPTLGDIEISSEVKGALPATRRLIAMTSGVDEDTLKGLRARDYRRVNEVLDSFL